MNIPYYDRTAMLVFVNNNHLMGDLYQDACEKYQEEFEDLFMYTHHALTEIFETYIKNDPYWSQVYTELGGKEYVPKKFYNPITDELQTILRKNGWRMFRAALIELAERHVQSMRLTFLPVDRWETILGKFQSLYRDMTIC